MCCWDFFLLCQWKLKVKTHWWHGSQKPYCFGPQFNPQIAAFPRVMVHDHSNSTPGEACCQVVRTLNSPMETAVGHEDASCPQPPLTYEACEGAKLEANLRLQSNHLRPAAPGTSWQTPHERLWIRTIWVKVLLNVGTETAWNNKYFLLFRTTKFGGHAAGISPTLKKTPNHIVLKIREMPKQYLHLYSRGTSQTYSQYPQSLLIQVFGETKKGMYILSSHLGHLAAGLQLQIYHWTSWGRQPVREKS